VLIRRESQLSPLVATIRQEVGGKLLLEHTKILEMIRRREPEGAAEAMASHIKGVMADVETFWEKMYHSEARNLKKASDRGLKEVVEEDLS